MQEPEDIDKLDLEKYELSYLEGRNLLTLTDSDMDKLLNALGNDDISLIVPLPCTSENVQRILSYSECRRCGKCCIPNPLNPDSPGVEIFEDELKEIAAYLGTPYETLKQETVTGKILAIPFQQTRLSFTRWSPLPCPYYIETSGECRVYPVRPVVCKVHPIVFGGNIPYFTIKVNCDYGKDLIKGAFRDLRKENPELII
ncbi:YkgJ family cysteine cluster protein [Chloroflexota bacterium]